MESSTVVLLITTFLGGGTLVAIIQAVANRRNVDAQRQNTLATGYGAFTDDLREELKETKTELQGVRADFDKERAENHIMRYYLADVMRYVAGVSVMCDQNNLNIPPPPPIPQSLAIP